jgi:hypothetical protein
MLYSNFYYEFEDENVSKNLTKLIGDGEMVELQKFSLAINSVLIAIGIIGNLMNIYVFCSKILRKKRFNSYLLSRSIFELIFCVILAIDYIFIYFNEYKIFLHDLNINSNKAIDYLLFTVDTYVTFLSFVLSIDRLWAIKHPVEHKNFLTYLYPKSITLTVLLISIFIKIPDIFACNQSSEKKLFEIVICTFISPLICNTIPSIAILIVNICLTVKMTQYYKCNKLSNEPSRHNSELKNIKEFRRISEQRNNSAFSRNSELRFNSEVRYNLDVKKNSEFRYSLELRHNSENTESISLNSNHRNLSKIKKSHYIVIILTSFWIVMTTFPYYSINFFHLLSNFNLNSLDIDYKLITYTQILTSILFNSNHCVNFFIYFSYHIEFRDCIFNTFFKIFHLFLKKRKSVDVQIEIQEL